MTIDEQHEAVEFGVNRIASFGLDDFLSSEIDYYINDAIDDYIKSQRERLLQGDSSASENIYTLLNTDHITSVTNDDSSYSSFSEPTTASLPSDLYYYVRSRSKVSSEWVDNEYLSIVDLFEYSNSNIDRPSYRKYPSTLAGSKIIVLPESGNTISEIDLMYIKEPAKVDKSGSVDCDLPVQTHRDINQIAIRLILSDLGAISDDS